MALNFTLKTEKIEFAGGDITVRGLSVPDITQLVLINKGSAIDLYEKFKKGMSAENVSDIAFDLATKSPAVVAHVISLAADAPDQLDQISLLPIDVQITALEKVAGLTFAMSGGLKNFIETVRRIGASANGLSESPLVSLT